MQTPSGSKGRDPEIWEEPGDDYSIHRGGPLQTRLMQALAEGMFTCCIYTYKLMFDIFENKATAQFR